MAEPGPCVLQESRRDLREESKLLEGVRSARAGLWERRCLFRQASARGPAFSLRWTDDVQSQLVGPYRTYHANDGIIG